MPDREKVILGLQAIYDEAYDRWVHTQYGGDKLVTLVSDVVPDALELLKENEPLPPRKAETGIGRGFFMCGDCGCSIIGDSNYCSNCGRAVKWDG